MRDAAHRHGLAAQRQRGRVIGEHQRRGPVGYQAAIGPAQRPGDQRVLVGNRAAEFVAEILAQLRVRVHGAVLVVLGGDLGHGVRRVAVALRVELRDLAEHAREAHARAVLLLDVGGFHQDFADLVARRFGHLFDADDQHDARLLRREGRQSHMDRRRTGGAGVFHARRGLEAQRLGRLENQRGREILLHEAAAEMTDINLVDVTRRHVRVGHGLNRDFGDQRFEVEPLALAEFPVRPADDASRHGSSSPD